MSLDLNLDGFISHREFVLLTFRGLNALDEEYADFDFSSIDRDRDGKISWPQFSMKKYGRAPSENEKYARAKEKVRLLLRNRSS